MKGIEPHKKQLVENNLKFEWYSLPNEGLPGDISAYNPAVFSKLPGNLVCVMSISLTDGCAL